LVFLVLGRGKTGSVVADVAHEHGHSVRVIGEEENRNASALTPPMLTHFDAVIDFTTPDAVIPNLRACLAAGARVVVGTTGWYSKLDEMRTLAEKRNAGLLYGTNFSIGVQALLRLTHELALTARGYRYSIRETHHATKLDKPSGTALSIKQSLLSADPSIEVNIASFREGDHAGLHVVEARSDNDLLEIRHEAFSRRGFAEGAVRAAEWLAGRTGCYEFSTVFPLVTATAP
jgi:4-hydroxy-tetrahydrodipicolinate reductase